MLRRSNMDVPNFFDDGLANIDPAMRPYFGGGGGGLSNSMAGAGGPDLGSLHGKHLSLQEDPYPLMYLDDQSPAVSAMGPGEFDHHGQYSMSTFTEPSAGFAGAAGTGTRSSTSSASPSLATASPGGTADGIPPTPRSARKSARSKSGSVSAEDVGVAAEESARKRKSRRKSKASEEGDGGDVDPKRNVVLARNRVAALKCRKKKKEFVSDLEEQRVDLEKRHHKLQSEYQTLVNEVANIKIHLMDHAHCQDPHIDNWLAIQAQRFVQTTQLKFTRTYGDANRLTFEQLLDTAAPVGGATSDTTSGTSTHRNSFSESVVSSARRNSVTDSQGGVAPSAQLTHSIPQRAWVNPAELTAYPAHSAQTSPTVPNFSLSLSGDAERDDV